MATEQKNSVDMEELYLDCMENFAESAPKCVMEAFKKLTEAFYDYVAAVSEDQWKIGYKYALNKEQ